MTVEIDVLMPRIVELETRLAFQDQTIEELNEVIISQQQQLDRLESALALIKRQLKQFGDVADETNGGHGY